MNGRLPVVLPPASGELFSSWIARHAAFYGVPSLTMLRHCLPDAVSLHIADRTLSRDQAGRLAEMFSMDAKTARRMTFADVQSSARRFIAKEPLQRCYSCTSGTSDPRPILRCDMQGWRITCPHCGRPFHDLAKSDRGHSFDQYHAAALRGEMLLDDDADASGAYRRTQQKPVRRRNRPFDQPGLRTARPPSDAVNLTLATPIVAN